MPPRRDFYEVLEVPATRATRTSSAPIARWRSSSTRSQSRDKEAEERFKECSAAYRSSPTQKSAQQYDRFGAAPSTARAAASTSTAVSRTSQLGIFGDFFGQTRVVEAGVRSRARRGDDLRYNLDLGFEEAAFGSEKTITGAANGGVRDLRRNGAKPGTKAKTCSGCRGSGQVRFQQGFFSIAKTAGSAAGRAASSATRVRSARGRGSSAGRRISA